MGKSFKCGLLVLAAMIGLACPIPKASAQTNQLSCLVNGAISVCPPAATNVIGVFQPVGQTASIQTAGVATVNLASASTTTLGDNACTNPQAGTITDAGQNACATGQRVGTINQSNYTAVSAVPVSLGLSPIVGGAGSLVCLSGSTIATCPANGTNIVGVFQLGGSIAVTNMAGYAVANLATASITNLGDYACSNSISAGTIIDNGQALCPYGQQAGFIAQTNSTPVATVSVFLNSIPIGGATAGTVNGNLDVNGNIVASGGVTASEYCVGSNCTTTLGGTTGLGNGTNVIDASLQTGADWCAKVIASQAILSQGGVIDTRGLSGNQTCSENVNLSSNSSPIKLLVPPNLHLSLGTGITLNLGSAIQALGSGGNSTFIRGNSSSALVTAGNSGGGEGPYEITGLDIGNAGTGPALNLNGITYANVHDNIFRARTGLIFQGYYNRITNNEFVGDTVTGILWAGILMDSVNSVNSNVITGSTCQGGTGTCVFVRGGYKNVFGPGEDYENAGLGIYDAATGTEIRGPYMEAVNCASPWVASTQYGLGAIIKDSNSDCEIAVTAGTSGSSVSWPAATAGNLGSNTVDGGVHWLMYSGVLLPNTSPAYPQCYEQTGILIDPSSSDAYIDGSTGPSNCILDLAAYVNSNYSSWINVTGNAAYGTAGLGPYDIYARHTINSPQFCIGTTPSCITSWPSGGGMVYPPAGIPKSTGLAWSSAVAAADIVALFAGGSCSGYLKSTGGCDSGTGGTVTATGTPAQYDAAYWTTATNLTKITAPITNLHTYVFAWQPSGSAVAPTALDAASLSIGGNSATSTDLAAYTSYSIFGSGNSAKSWITPTGNGQCLMSAASSFATTTPSFQNCPAGTGTLTFTGSPTQYQSAVISGTSTVTGYGPGKAGQTPVSNGASAYPSMASPGIGTGNGGVSVSTAGYKVQCDNGSSVLDGGKLITFVTGASAPVIPDPSDSGCGVGFAFRVAIVSGGPITFNNETSATFTLMHSFLGKVSSPATLFTLQNGATAFFVADSTTHYMVIISEGPFRSQLTLNSSSWTAGTSGSYSSGAIGSAAYATFSIAVPGADTTTFCSASFGGSTSWFSITGFIPSTSGGLNIAGQPSSGYCNFTVTNNTNASITLPNTTILNVVAF